MEAISMKKIICTLLCFILIFSLCIFPVNAESEAEYVFASPEVHLTNTKKSESDIVYSFSLFCEDAAAYEQERLKAYEELKTKYTDKELIALGEGRLLYETVLLINAEKDGEAAYVGDVSVTLGGFSLSLTDDLLPRLAPAGIYEHSDFDFTLTMSIALKFGGEYIEASPAALSDKLFCPATARIIYNISEKAENPNPCFIFLPYDDYILKNASLEGYTFAGWETESGFVDRIPANTEEYTLTARWNAKTYKISYVLTTRPGPFIYVNNTGNPKTHVFGVEIEIFALNAPMGYVFGGWFENADFTGEPVTKIAADRTGDILLFARWLTEEEAENERFQKEHWGDLDDDGKITAADARLALRCAVGLEKLESAVLSRADFEGSKVLTAENARLILRIAVGLDTLKEILTLYGRL